jgi:hypothetical protein
MAPTTQASAKFFVEIIKPSHYDDDGYIIQWCHRASVRHTSGRIAIPPICSGHIDRGTRWRLQCRGTYGFFPEGRKKVSPAAWAGG